jgi:AbrB family looped-hinge helix DNA binding protein
VLTSRLSSKGQIVLPKKIRDSHAWKPGTEFLIEETDAGVLLRPAKPFPKTTVEEVFGCLGYNGKPKTLAQMNAAVTREAARRHARGRY